MKSRHNRIIHSNFNRDMPLLQVGQLIGDGKAADARRSCIVAYSVNFVVQLLLIATLLPCGRLLADLFSTDNEVADLIADLIPLSCIFMVGDAFQTNTGGVMRGLGRQKLVLFLNILGFWVLVSSSTCYLHVVNDTLCQYITIVPSIIVLCFEGDHVKI
mmetsp:Transcript_4297/g.6292  ORF Transcript_4297/g.6292 Transcript_4297/m.6292 type:complete len:159 (+) Transcript_4297:1276-1752(+)